MILPIGERRDDQSIGTTEIFIHVFEVDIRDGNSTHIGILVEVESALFQPIEFARGTSFVRHQFIKDILLMDVNGDQRFDFHTIEFGQIFGGLVNQRIENVQKFLRRISHDLLVGFCVVQGDFGVTSPQHL